MEPQSTLSALLKGFYLKRQARNQAYSLRAFARDLGISHSHLVRIINGDRSLSANQVVRMSQRASLEPEEVESLKNALLKILQERLFSRASVSGGNTQNPQ